MLCADLRWSPSALMWEQVKKVNKKPAQHTSYTAQSKAQQHTARRSDQLYTETSQTAAVLAAPPTDEARSEYEVGFTS